MGVKAIDIIPIHRYNQSMLADYLNEKGISIYKAAKETGIPYSTLNDLSNGRVEVGNCKTIHVRKLSKMLGISMDEIYDICESNIETIKINDDNNVEDIKDINVYVKNKSFYARFKYKGGEINLPICGVRKDISTYISDLTRWEIEDYISNQEWEKYYEILADEKK